MNVTQHAGYRLTTTQGNIYLLRGDGAILYDGKRHMHFGTNPQDKPENWRIVGFVARANARMITPYVALTIPGQGWIVDFDHGHYRQWGGGKPERAQEIVALTAEEFDTALKEAN